ncbi:MAG: T9SS type A sorting domain-containing protein, partial [Bacteroidales bacterium]|nr:T9SS type A sorting domain-containing protein [Bacteroidales bacterium]
GAVDYFVYRNQDLLTTTTELSFDDTNAVSTETLYMVIARNTCGVSISGIDYGNAMVISAIDPDDQGLTIQPVIFPNPSSGDFYFDAGSLFFAGDIEFKVTDMSGSVIFNQHMQISSDESVKLPIELAPGFYVVMIWQGNKIFKEKLMVQ